MFNGAVVVTSHQNQLDLAPNFAASIVSVILVVASTSGFAVPMFIAFVTSEAVSFAVSFVVYHYSSFLTFHFRILCPSGCCYLAYRVRCSLWPELCSCCWAALKCSHGTDGNVMLTDADFKTFDSYTRNGDVIMLLILSDKIREHVFCICDDKGTLSLRLSKIMDHNEHAFLRLFTFICE